MMTKRIIQFLIIILVFVLSLSGCGSSSPAAVNNTITPKILLGGAIQGTPLKLGTIVTTLAGSGSVGALDGIGLATTFGGPQGITTDGSSIYVADTQNNIIRKIVISTGVVTTIAGSGIAGRLDGTGTAATFKLPYHITTDGINLYIADQPNNKIRKIAIATGVVTTIAGSNVGLPGFSDGIGTAATFNQPSGITTDGANLYVADSLNNAIRKITISTGVVTIFAGTGTSGALDGIGSVASFNQPFDICTDGSNLYVADTQNNKIRKIIISTGEVVSFAGSGIAGALDSTATAATFNKPVGITTDGFNLYVVEALNNKIRKIVISTGVVTTLAGSGVASALDGTGTAATFNTPCGITTDGINLYVSDTTNNKIRKIQ